MSSSFCGLFFTRYYIHFLLGNFQTAEIQSRRSEVVETNEIDASTYIPISGCEERRCLFEVIKHTFLPANEFDNGEKWLKLK